MVDDAVSVSFHAFARVGKPVQAQLLTGVSLLIAEGLARVEGSKLIWSSR